MMIPPVFACMWVATLGGTALYSDLNNGTKIAEAVDADVTSAIFATFEHMPFTGLLSAFSILTYIYISCDFCRFCYIHIGEYDDERKFISPISC